MEYARFAPSFRPPYTPLTLTLSAIALAALLAGCAPSPTAAVSPTTTPFIYYAPTATATSTPLPSAPLTWRKATLPDGSPVTPDGVAPSDGATAYACAAPSVSGETGPIEQPRILVTHDFAAHWTRMANIPADKVNNQCVLHVDRFNPSIVVAILMWDPSGAGGGPDITGDWVSFNGGASWRNLAGAQLYEMDLDNPTATRNGLTYAIRGVLSGHVVYNGLWVSSDHMTTWRSIDPPGFGSANYSTFAVSFWVSQATGEMIAVYGSEDAAYPPTTLWDTHDGGAHWTQLTTPGVASLPMERNPYLAWAPGPHAPLTICNTTVGVSADDLSGAFPLWCSVDGGKTWQTRPNILPIDAAENTPQEAGSVFAIADDGSLLATLSDGSITTLYQLASGASQWRSLGDMPEASFGRSASLGSAVVWSGINSSLPPVLAPG